MTSQDDAENLVLAGHMSSTATASHIAKTEVVRSTETFSDIVRGLHVFGRKVIAPRSHRSVSLRLTNRGDLEMAVYTVTGAVAGVPLGIKPQIIEVVLDFSSTSLTTSDSVEVFEMKANTLVLMAGVEILTVASTGSPVLDLGDDDDDDLYVAALSGTATGHEINNAAGTAKLYTAADTIDLIANTATFDGKVRVFAVIAEMGTAETAATFA